MYISENVYLQTNKLYVTLIYVYNITTMCKLYLKSLPFNIYTRRSEKYISLIKKKT